MEKNVDNQNLLCVLSEYNHEDWRKNKSTFWNFWFPLAPWGGVYFLNLKNIVILYLTKLSHKSKSPEKITTFRIRFQAWMLLNFYTFDNSSKKALDIIFDAGQRPGLGVIWTCDPFDCTSISTAELHH